MPNRNRLLLFFTAEYIFWHLVLFASLFLAGSPTQDTLIYTHPDAFNYVSDTSLWMIAAIMTGRRWWKWNSQQRSIWTQTAKIAIWIVIVLNSAGWILSIILLAAGSSSAKYSFWQIVSFVVLDTPRQLTAIVFAFEHVSVIWIFCLTILIKFLIVFCGLFAGQQIMLIYHKYRKQFQ